MKSSDPPARGRSRPAPFDSRQREPAAALVWVLLLCALALLYWSSLVWINRVVRETDSYYTHGWVMAAAVLFLLWLRRDRLAASPVRPAWAGLPLLLAGLALQLGGRVFRINFISAWSLLLTLAGLSLFNWGLPRTRLLFGPLLLLGFVIPLPGIAIIALAFRLKVASVWAALLAVRWLGIEAWPNGFQIVLPWSPPGEPLAIGDPCSGLRSLISFGALGGFCAFLFPLSRPRRLAVFLAAVALAPFNNALRIALMVVLRQTVGPAVLRGSIHIALGVGVYIVCLLLYLLVIRCLIRSAAPPPAA